MMKMRTQSILYCFLLIFSLYNSICSAAAPTLEQQCSSEFPKVAPCLNYTTGKAASPSNECCTSVTDINIRVPVCLCFIVQQIHKSSPGIKHMDLQEARVLHLGSVCKVANASVSNCPKLLNLSPSSPDYAYFTNSSSADSSNAFMDGPHLPGSTAITVAVTIFISGFMMSILGST